MESLETRRLTLTPLVEGDARHLWPILSDARTMHHWPQPYTYAEVERWVARAVAVRKQVGLSRCLLRRKSDGRVVGDAGIFLLPVADLGEVLDLGWMVHWPHQGQGYASEAAAAIRDLALGPLKLGRLIVNLNWKNHPSRRVAEKLGARYLRRFYNHRYRWTPTDLYELRG
jgi:RimJ/RimL family protein N-acetyltransferase